MPVTSNSSFQSENLSQAQGLLILFGVYLAFGLSPLYWNLLKGVSAFEMVCHRTLWGSLFVAIYIGVKRQYANFFWAWKTPREVFFIGLCSFAHLWNWWIYVWAVTNGKILECSLGHYIVPHCCPAKGIKKGPKSHKYVL